MKKMFGVLLLFMAVFCFLTVKKEPLTAYAAESDSANYLDVEVKCLTAADVAYYHNSTRFNAGGNLPLQVGYYALTLTIHNNNGLAGTGTQIIYNDQYCVPVTYKNASNKDVAVYHRGEVLPASYAVTLNMKDYATVFGVATQGLEEITGDGKIITFFVKPKTALTLNEEKNWLKTLL